ncbi:MAG: sulfite exporter TauE/SafE family protein, partial [Actinomycetota bacterium]|nr:sulfite exporter TauE/SafE family protein [Actinomycetota bacterium]
MQELLVALAGFVGGFFSTLASNGSSVTLPALGLLGLPEHEANGTNRLSVVALGLVGTVHFARLGLIDWREGVKVAVLIALGTV